jgi:glycosyltransferase involved in cell wall biosynthesis
VGSILECPFRRDIRQEMGQETATCALLARTFGPAAELVARVRRDVCEACCRAACQGSCRCSSHVLGAVTYQRAQQLLRQGGSELDRSRLARLKEEAQYRLRSLSPLVNRAPGALGVLGRGERRLAREGRSGPPLSWAVAVLTAPRSNPTLRATLESLMDAGFDNIHLFAEPDAAIPAEHSRLPLVRQRERQGPLRSFCIAARTLLACHPSADCYAIFEDDLSAARGLRHWCDQELWPADHGVVSLYTSQVVCDDVPGWQTLNLGRYRTFGALAFVFQGAALRDLLEDVFVRRHVEAADTGADAVVGEWALRRGIGIAYHSPSLIQHEGRTTSLPGHEIGRVGRAVAVQDIRAVDTWRRPKGQPGKVGLVGWNTRTGLGYQNRDIAIHLPAARWLAPPHPRYPRLARPCMHGEYWAPRTTPSSPQLRSWLRGLDWVLFVELPYLPGIAQLARSMGINVACVPNWEWLTVDTTWLPFVDLMICPTKHTYRMLCQWRRDLGFAWDVVYVPWPIDPERFRYRRRQRCGKFLFINGTGGVPGRRVDGSCIGYHRKGAELMAATARLLKSVPFLFYSQRADLPPLPDNVEARRPPSDNRDLYTEGDVCVQPSHWEGLGLQLLECQAAGLPLVTTDAAPMNECQPFRAVPATETELVFVYGDQPVESRVIHPEALAEALHALHGSDVRQASEQARAYIERERSWPRLRQTIAAWLPA